MQYIILSKYEYLHHIDSKKCMKIIEIFRETILLIENSNYGIRIYANWTDLQHLPILISEKILWVSIFLLICACAVFSFYEYNIMSCSLTRKSNNFDWQISEKWQNVFFLSCFPRSKCTNCLPGTIMMCRPPYQCLPKIFYVIHLNNKLFTLANPRFIRKLEKDYLLKGTVFDSA